MKKSMMNAVCMLLGFFLSVSLYAQDKLNADSIVGEWNYEMEGAPMGYEKGVFKAFSTNNKLSGEVIIDGDVMKINELKKTAEGEYNCTVYVDGSMVDVVIKKKTNGFEGYATVEGRDLPITFKRVTNK